MEIWEWKERKELERLEEKYNEMDNGDGRWLYLVRKELQREELKVRAERRAWRFEEKLEETKESKVARRYWEEMRGRMTYG